MADGRYYARAERTKRVMSDAEVLRLHAHRDSLDDQVKRLLDEEVARDPVSHDQRQLGHLYLIAQPINASRRLAHNLVRGTHPQNVYDLVLLTPQKTALKSRDIDLPPQPWAYATTRANRARGVGMSSSALTADRSLAPSQNPRGLDDGGLLDIELRDDGGIRVLVGHMTTPTTSPYGGPAPLQVVMDGLAVAYTRYLIDWAVGISKRTGWHGSWMLGLHADGLRGLSSRLYCSRLTAMRVPAFDVDDYREVTMASHLEMSQNPQGVAYRLVGRLTEALGTYGEFKDDLALTTPSET